MAEYDTLGVIDNLLTLDEVVAEAKRIAEDAGVDKDNIRLAALDGQILVEEEFELDD